MGYEVTAKSTQFGYGTPFGFKTPHKYPQDLEQSLSETFLGLTKQLYPTGRAFNIPEKSTYEKLHKGINTSMIRLTQDVKSVVNKSIPDNDDFVEADATLWENKLGLFINPATTLENRKSAIMRKMAYPTNIKARQNPNFLEAQLRLSGFNVRVYENKFLEGGEWVHKTPDEVAATSATQTQHGGTLQHGGGTQHGSGGFSVIANSLDSSENYNVGGGSNLWASFYISGDTVNEMATVDKAREKEFRELVLKLKPAHLVAFLFINFI
ncbi:hypothetical protein C7967_11547 [Thalassospira sp. 11-3]|nr:hypothetical protein C7967_11547 [Thalassospira sp. 11-3]